MSTPGRKRAGQRRTRITLWSSGTAKDVIGGQTQGEFVQFGSDSAAVDETVFMKDAVDHGKTFRVTIKYRPDVLREFETLKKRVQVRADGLILSVAEIEKPERRNIELVLDCTEAGT